MKLFVRIEEREARVAARLVRAELVRMLNANRAEMSPEWKPIHRHRVRDACQALRSLRTALRQWERLGPSPEVQP